MLLYKYAVFLIIFIFKRLIPLFFRNFFNRCYDTAQEQGNCGSIQNTVLKSFLLIEKIRKTGSCTVIFLKRFFTLCYLAYFEKIIVHSISGD